MKKKLGICLAVLFMCLGLVRLSDTVWAASGKTAVSVSAGSVNIGDTVTVTAKATGESGEQAVATMALTWDSGVLEFVSCSTIYGGGGGSVTAVGDSFTVTLKAVSAGTSAISLSASDGVVFGTNEGLDSMAGSSTSVTVNNAAAADTSGSGSTDTSGSSGGSGETTTQSADNSLKSLTISPGTLSPAFSGSTTTYSATVSNDVTSIAVSATPANASAVVESVSGNSNLSVGSNVIKVVVRAENGVTATYTINVTRQAASTTAADSQDEEETDDTEVEETVEGISVGGITYLINEDFDTEAIPADFAETTINYHGMDYRGVSFNNGSLNMLSLQAAGEAETEAFFIYDATRDTFYPFVKLGSGEKYVIALLAPVDFVMPDTYQQTTLVLGDGSTITAYQEITEEETEIASDFYLFYGVNYEGTEGWYQYDAMEETYQRISWTIEEEEETEEASDLEYLQEAYSELSEKYTQERAFARNAIGILIFVVAVLAIIILNLLLHRFRKKDDDFPDDDFPDDDFPGGGTDGFPDDNFPGDGTPDDDALNDDALSGDFPDETLSGEDKTPMEKDVALFEESSELPAEKNEFLAEETRLMAEENEFLAEETRLMAEEVRAAAPEEEPVLENSAAGEAEAVSEEAASEEPVTEEDEEKAERRRARELFFAEEPEREPSRRERRKKERKRKTAFSDDLDAETVVEEPVRAEKSTDKPLQKTEEKKEEERDSGDLEVIDFNDL